MALYIITNSLFAKNSDSGIKGFFIDSSSRVEFNTIVDNGADGFNCQVSERQRVVREQHHRSQHAADEWNRSWLHLPQLDHHRFRHHSAELRLSRPAPFDYHIQTGSVAIDQATITTIDHDIDGDPRLSNMADVGADELP